MSFENESAPLACVVPTLAELFAHLQRHARRPACIEVSTIYEDCAAIVRRRCLDTVNCIFQLAFVLTPIGRHQAREERLRRIVLAYEPEDRAEQEFTDHMECVGLQSPNDRRFREDDNDDLLLSSQREDEVGSDIEMHFEAQNGVETSEDGDVVTPSSVKDLYPQAEAGLREILEQYHLNVSDTDEIIGYFQEFVGEAATYLEMKPIPSKNRYAWAVGYQRTGTGEILADIAQRLESLVCSEAVSERTNSAMKRMLSPFRLRMSPDILLSRLTIARHGTLKLRAEFGSLSC
jgi:hypothetical protein